MEHNSKKTIQKISKLGNIIMICALGLSCLGVILLVVAGLGVAFLPDMLPDDMDMDLFTYQLTAAAVGCAILAIVFFLLSKLTDNISEKSSPFTQDNVTIMKRISLVLVVGFLIDSAIRTVLALALGLGSDVVKIGPMPLLLAAIVYFLALIFQYGVELQEESDSFL